MIVDAHHHFWDPTRVDYPWLTDELVVIRRAFGPADLAPLLLPTGVEATVLVQTRSDIGETEDFLAIAATTPFIQGVIGWVDLCDPGVGDTLARLRAGPGGRCLVGIRHQVHDEPDPLWLDRPDVRRGIAAVGAAGFVYDLLVRARELPAAGRLIRDLPDVRFVVDHLAKPTIRLGSDPAWETGVAALADLPNLWWKLSGLVTEADWLSWRPADLQPFVERVIGVTGPTRLLFGSDWPVCLLAASYETVAATARTLIASLTPSEQAAILGETAVSLYGLGRDPSPEKA